MMLIGLFSKPYTQSKYQDKSSLFFEDAFINNRLMTHNFQVLTLRQRVFTTLFVWNRSQEAY